MIWISSVLMITGVYTVIDPSYPIGSPNLNLILKQIFKKRRGGSKGRPGILSHADINMLYCCSNIFIQFQVLLAGNWTISYMIWKLSLKDLFNF